MTTYKTGVVLGKRYRDSQTGIEGVATAISFFQFGCERVELETVLTDGNLKGYAFDAPRLVEAKTEKPVEHSGRTGGPRDSVPQRSVVSR